MSFQVTTRARNNEKSIYFTSPSNHHTTITRSYKVFIEEYDFTCYLFVLSISLSALGALVVHNGEQGFHKQLR